METQYDFELVVSDASRNIHCIATIILFTIDHVASSYMLEVIGNILNDIYIKDRPHTKQFYISYIIWLYHL